MPALRPQRAMQRAPPLAWRWCKPPLVLRRGHSPGRIFQQRSNQTAQAPLRPCEAPLRPLRTRDFSLARAPLAARTGGERMWGSPILRLSRCAPASPSPAAVAAASPLRRRRQPQTQTPHSFHPYSHGELLLQ